MDCVLRVGGKNFDKKSFLKKSKWKVTSIWKKPFEHPYFNLLISRKIEFSEQVDDVIKFLGKNTGNFKLIKELRGEAVFDFGVDLDGTYFCKNCIITNKLMDLCIKSNVKIDVSVYQEPVWSKKLSSRKKTIPRVGQKMVYYL